MCYTNDEYSNSPPPPSDDEQDIIIKVLRGGHFGSTLDNWPPVKVGGAHPAVKEWTTEKALREIEDFDFTCEQFHEGRKVCLYVDMDMDGTAYEHFIVANPSVELPPNFPSSVAKARECGQIFIDFHMTNLEKMLHRLVGNEVQGFEYKGGKEFEGGSNPFGIAISSNTGDTGIQIKISMHYKVNSLYIVHKKDDWDKFWECVGVTTGQGTDVANEWIGFDTSVCLKNSNYRTVGAKKARRAKKPLTQPMDKREPLSAVNYKGSWTTETDEDGNETEVSHRDQRAHIVQYIHNDAEEIHPGVHVIQPPEVADTAVQINELDEVEDTSFLDAAMEESVFATDSAAEHADPGDMREYVRMELRREKMTSYLKWFQPWTNSRVKGVILKNWKVMCGFMVSMDYTEEMFVKWSNGLYIQGHVQEQKLAGKIADAKSKGTYIDPKVMWQGFMKKKLEGDAYKYSLTNVAKLIPKDVARGKFTAAMCDVLQEELSAVKLKGKSSRWTTTGVGCWTRRDWDRCWRTRTLLFGFVWVRTRRNRAWNTTGSCRTRQKTRKSLLGITTAKTLARQSSSGRKMCTSSTSSRICVVAL